MLSVKKRKEVFYHRLNSLLKPKDFKLINTGEDPRYLLKNENRAIWFLMHFKRGGSVSVSLRLTLFEIEDIVTEIGRPNREDMSIFLDRKKYFLPTLRDVHFENSIKEKYHLYAFKTEDEFTRFSQWTSTYIENQGLAYLEHYSFLPNILAKMDKLTTEEKYWNGILSGLADYLFRGLIISKLCGDPNYQIKVNYCDVKLNSRASLVEWLPYYNKLKERLKTIEPKYQASEGQVFEDINT